VTGPDPVAVDAPEADVVEQRLLLDADQDALDVGEIGTEVPEADALEQGRPAPVDDDDYRAG
jgi:hypothetical protein